jgi:hypothetical protein
MRKIIQVVGAIGVVGILVAPSLAQQTQYPTPSQPPAAQSQHPQMAPSPETKPSEPSRPTQPPAAQTEQPSMPSQPSAAQSVQGRQVRTIDCPPSAITQQQHTGAVGTPQGAGTGSGLNAMPSIGPPQQLEGTIKTIASTRTNRIIEVGDLKLEVEPSTVVLVGCKQASVAELKEGSKIKAAYEVKDQNRNVATVIEAQK